MPRLSRATRARVRSQSGAHAGEFLFALPTCDLTLVTPERFNLFLRRRARLPLTTGRSHCTARICYRRGCSRLNQCGDHPASCLSTGGLRRRGAAFERAFRPLWVEAVVQAREHPLVSELILGIRGRQSAVGRRCAGHVHAERTPPGWHSVGGGRNTTTGSPSHGALTKITTSTQNSPRQTESGSWSWRAKKADGGARTCTAW